MHKTMLAFVIGAVAAVPTLGCSPEGVTLVEDGVAKCRIVVEKGTPPSAAFGAKEIAKYFQKVTGCGEIEIECAAAGEGARSTEQSRRAGASPAQSAQSRSAGASPAQALIPIRISTNSQLPPESFVLDVKPEGIDIAGADARGVLYGCYEVLKRWAGMRWLEQGEQGEYCVRARKSVNAPVHRTSSSLSCGVVHGYHNYMRLRFAE